jgi:hypothetical protein
MRGALFLNGPRSRVPRVDLVEADAGVPGIPDATLEATIEEVLRMDQS